MEEHAEVQGQRPFPDCIKVTIPGFASLTSSTNDTRNNRTFFPSMGDMADSVSIL